MNNNSLKKIAIITSVCLIVLLLFSIIIKLLPYLIFVGLVCFVIIWLKGRINKNKIMKDSSNNSNNSEHGEVIDVDFREE